MTTKEEVLTALEEVEDPELDISIVLGLVYDVRFEDKDGVQHAEVDMTLTSPGVLPLEIMAGAHRAALNAVESVHINLVWSPRWDPKVHASEDAKWIWEFGINHSRLLPVKVVLGSNPFLRNSSTYFALIVSTVHNFTLTDVIVPVFLENFALSLVFATIEGTV